MRENDLHPYFVVESWEEEAFRDRFAAATPLGELDWPPRAEIRGVVVVRIYDPADRDEFLQTGAVRTERVFP